MQVAILVALSQTRGHPDQGQGMAIGWRSHCFGWFYAAACCWSHSFGWLSSVVCYWSARKSWWLSTAMEMSWWSKGGPLCGKSGQDSSFNAWGRSTLIFWLVGRGVWCGVEGRRSCCGLLSSKCQLLFSPALSTATKVSYNVTCASASTTVTNFPLIEGAMEAFRLWKIQCSGLQPLLYPYQSAKERRYICLLDTSSI